MDNSDWERIERFRASDEDDWAAVTSRGPRVPDDRAWTRWLAGDLPDYPEQILQANYQEVARRLEKVMADEQDLTKMDVHHWQQVNPVLTEALVHLTTGGPQTVYWGGLAAGRLRYWDADRRRSGLPQDVAALVRSLSADGARVSLVNLSVRDTHEVIIGAGNVGISDSGTDGGTTLLPASAQKPVLSAARYTKTCIKRGALYQDLY